MTDAEAADREALGLLGLARRAGRAVIGADAVRTRASSGSLVVLVVARNAGANARKRVSGAIGECPVVAIGTRRSLGRAVGRGEAALVGVTDRELGARIVSLVRRRRESAGSDGRTERTQQT